jgi:diguanylate cyclase (GGDEF)-like protein
VSYLDVCDRAGTGAADGAAEAAAVASGLRQLLSGEREHFDLEYPCPSPEEDRWFMLQASAAPVSNGAGVVLFHVDITARKLLGDRLASLAGCDALTGLPDRRSAFRFIEELQAAARSTGGSMGVLFLGVDGFKDVNEHNGHHVGDELLVQIVLRLRRAVRERDRLCRLGGDELLLVCPDLDDAKATTLSERLRRVVFEPFQIGAVEVSVGISVGFARSRSNSTADSLVATADDEMYLDKRRRFGRRGHATTLRRA